MKRLLKYLGITLGVLISAILVFALYVNFSDIPSYSVEKIEYHSVSTPESVERGKILALMLCSGCHRNIETGKLTGMRMLEAPPEFGVINSANITQDKQYGIGEWTDAEILYLLRTGIKRDGKYAPPYMAKLPNMADEDINAIISFLKSDDPMVAADATADRPTEPAFLTKLLCKVAWKPFPLPTEPIPMPDTNNTVTLGKYLAHNLECFSCHSSDFKTNNFIQPELSEGYFAGGNKPLDRQGRVMLTPNLTPDMETGLGKWTKANFVKAVKSGIVDNSPALAYPMLPYTHLTDAEVGAIYDYLMTIPPINNKVERSIYD